jgi:tetratricopeptide (TPR) repeat protein
LSPELVEISGGAAPVTRWQDEYDADLADVFEVQARIATQVARALEVALETPPARQFEERPTSNLAAYDAYLKGAEIFSRAPREAAPQFERAVALDPNFALAWAYLSLSQSVRYMRSMDSNVAEAAHAAAEKALTLSPRLWQAFWALGTYERYVTGNAIRGGETFRLGLQIAPDNVDLLRGLGFANEELGKPEEALVLMRRAVGLDPRSWLTQDALVRVLLVLHRPDEARAAADRGLALNPGNLALFVDKAWAFLEEGDLVRARALIAIPPKEIDVTMMVADFGSDGNAWVLDNEQRDLLLRLTPTAFAEQQSDWGLALADAYWVEGKLPEALKYAEQAQAAYQKRIERTPAEPILHVERAYVLAILGRTKEAAAEAARAVELAKNLRALREVLVWLPRTYVLTGDKERAIRTTEQVLKAQDFITPAYLRIDPHYAPLRVNPRFQKLIAQE